MTSGAEEFLTPGAPHVGALHRHPSLGAALVAITAAVVRVILNLGVTFAWHAVFPTPGGRPVVPMEFDGTSQNILG